MRKQRFVGEARPAPAALNGLTTVSSVPAGGGDREQAPAGPSSTMTKGEVS